MQDTEKRAKFKEILCEFSNKFALSLGSECIEEVLSEREIAEFKARLKFYNELRKEVQLRFCEEDHRESRPFRCEISVLLWRIYF